MEPTPDEYVAHMVEVFAEVKRVLKPTGVCWLNLGDSYVGGNAKTREGPLQSRGRKWEGNDQLATLKQTVVGLKPKDLIGVPWRVALALQADGWWLRDAIIWAKAEMTTDWQTQGSTMPGSQRDRCTGAYEFVFMLTKRERYWWDGDAIKSTTSWPRNVWRINPKPYSGAHYATMAPKLAERCILAGCPARVCAKCGKPWERVVERIQLGERDDAGRTHSLAEQRRSSPGAPPERGWEVEHKTVGFRPTCKCNAETVPGIVFDPFVGSGTTVAVAVKLGRRGIGLDLSGTYLHENAQQRVAAVAPMLAL